MSSLFSGLKPNKEKPEIARIAIKKRVNGLLWKEKY